MSGTRARSAFTDLGTALGIDDLQLDENGYAALGFDDLLVNFELDEERDRLLLTASLGQPEGNKQAAYELLMSANYLWQGTGGGTLALEESSGEIILQKPLPIATLDQQALEMAIEIFVDTAELWAQQLAAGSGDESTDDEQPMPPGGILRA